MKRSFRTQVGLVCLVGLTVRLVYLLLIRNFRHADLNFDSTWYHLEAVLIAHGHGYLDPQVWFQGTRGSRAGFHLSDINVAHPAKVVLPTLQFPPLFPAALAVGSLLFTDSLLTHQLMCCLFGTVTVGLIALLGQRVSGSPEVGVLAGVIAAVDPMLFQPDGAVLVESLYGVFAAAMLLAAYRVVDRPTGTRWALLGLIGGAAALTRGEGSLICLVIIGCTAAASTIKRRQLAMSAVAVAVLAVTITPWVVRNSELLGRLTFVSDNTQVTLAGANCPTSYYGPGTGYWDYRCIDRISLPVMTEANQARVEAIDQRTYSQAAKSYAEHHLTRIPIVVAARVLRTWDLYWDPVEQVKIEASDGRTVAFEALGQLLSVFLLPFAVVGLLRLRKQQRTIKPLIGVMVAVTVESAIFYGQSRFRISAEPAIIVAASTSLISLIRPRLRSSRPFVADAGGR